MIAPTDGPGDDGGIFTKNRGIGDGTVGAYGIILNDIAADRIDGKYSDGQSRNAGFIGEQWGSVWQYLAYWRDIDTLKTIVGQIGTINNTTTNVAGLELNGDNVTQRAITIGQDATGASTPYEGYIAWIRVSKGARSLKQMNEAWALASGWNSVSGKVTREYSGTNLSFHQGFYDSEIVYDTLGITGTKALYGDSTWIVTFDAKGTKSGDAVTVWIGSPTTNKVPKATLTLTAGSNNRSIAFNDATLSSGDQLVFQASSGDSIYIDNIEVRRGYNQYVGKGRFSRFKKSW
jgi:hypothetical protein